MPKKRILILTAVLVILLAALLVFVLRPAASPDATPAPTGVPVSATATVPEQGVTYHRYSASFDSTFDTVISLIGYAESEEVFAQAYAETVGMFTEYHRLFDAYHTYEGMENLCSINQKAGIAPVRVDAKLFDFLTWCVAREREYGTGQVNIAMGAVLQLWHSYREAGIADPANAALPPMDALRDASLHMDLSHVVLDPEAMTVFFEDPALKLDFGAVAKGYAAQAVADRLAASAMPSFILNAGGNVCAGQPKADTGALWGIGIQDPDGGLTGNDLYDTIFAANRAVVTSGDYQRFYVVSGKRYAHLISPDTLMPAEHFRGVTVVAQDSGLCDFLSTYLFIADYETGRALVESLPGVEALWIMADDRSARYTAGMAAYLKSAGATNGLAQ